jgi:ABC-type glutathione transport system ATPase component
VPTQSSPEGDLLRVENLQVHFRITKGAFPRAVSTVRAVDGVSFAIQLGETLGLVGESGCGRHGVRERRQTEVAVESTSQRSQRKSG